MTHAAKVAFALFADIANKKNGQGMLHLADFQRARDGKQSGNPRAVVRNAGAKELGSLLADIQRRIGREDRINMRA
jgi:hypothetical protein